MLSSTQYEFRKGRGTRDCLALLTTDISSSLEIKEQTVVSFKRKTDGLGNNEHEPELKGYAVEKNFVVNSSARI
jgi:hypothetical protein